MDKISELLQEAKPLYFKRKKRIETIKKSMFLILPLIICAFAVLPFIINATDETNYYTSSTSIVEQMGFPTDDYGLLKVD